jgi:PleD family two-component response regulator
MDSHQGSFENLYKAADRAAYQSKQKGRNSVTFDNRPESQEQTG